MKCRDCKDEAAPERTRCEKHLAHYREYARKNMERIRSQSLMRKYGIDLEEYNAMHEAQGGLCAICGKPETMQQKGRAVSSLAVDHDHETGAVRALLCGHCNKGLGHFMDNPELLLAAAKYLNDFGFTY